MKWVILSIMMVDAVVLISNVLYWVMPIFREGILKKLVFSKVVKTVSDMEDETRIKELGFSENMMICQRKLAVFIAVQAIIYSILFFIAMVLGQSNY